jgi:putative ABC transport system ATP-binding protein
LENESPTPNKPRLRNRKRRIHCNHGTIRLRQNYAVNIIGCIDKATNGKVLFDGIDIAKMSESKLYKIRRDKIGFVFQNFNLLPYLNARENVELAMELAGKFKGQRKQRALELLGTGGLSGREQHRPQRLSQGEQQRVAIARALANDPAIILADEPTGNLDVTNKQEIVKLLSTSPEGGHNNNHGYPRRASSAQTLVCLF